MRFGPVWGSQCLWCITHDCMNHKWTLISLFITDSWWPSWDTVLWRFQNCRSFVLFQSRGLNRYSVAFHFHRVTFQSVLKCESHDCLLIGQSTPVLITSWRWIDRLTPQDYCGFICSCTYRILHTNVNQYQSEHWKYIQSLRTVEIFSEKDVVFYF